MRVLLTGMSGTGKSAFDYRVLLTAPRAVLVERLRTRTNNPYGRDSRELAQVLADLAAVEPLLRRSADLVLTTTAPTEEIADVLLRRIAIAVSHEQA